MSSSSSFEKKLKGGGSGATAASSSPSPSSSSSSSSSSSFSKKDREFDIIVFGATGFTGTLACRHLTRSAATIKWAIAGRDRKKLEELRTSLITLSDRHAPNDIIIADVKNPDSIRSMVERTRVVISTAGPFTLYGEGVIAACAATGTNYCDTSGELSWIRKMIDKYHIQANETGALIVPMAAYESLLSDLGTLYVVDRLRTVSAQPYLVKGMYECNLRALTPSGGTYQSMIAIMREPNAMKESKMLHLLDPNPHVKARPEEKDQMFLQYDNDFGTWTIPFFGAVANSRAVRRSIALFKDDDDECALSSSPSKQRSYGPDFIYQETFKGGSFIKSFLLFIGLIFLILFSLFLWFPRIRNLIEKYILYPPGKGPSEEIRNRNYFKYTFIGKGRVKTATGEKIETVKAIVRGGDAFYSETAKMVSETGLCLLNSQIDGVIPNLSKRRGGVLTPATACGPALIERLSKVGIQFAMSAPPSIAQPARGSN